MRCNRRLLYVKVKSFLVLSAILSFLIVLVTVVNRRPSFLKTVPYGVNLNFKYSPGKPGEFLSNYKINNESYCNFKYSLPENFVYGEVDVAFSPELFTKSTYRVLYNVLEAKRESFNTSAPVTYATHVTPEFVDYISEIARHWEGAVSVAAFVPDDDADVITSKLMLACQCLPEMSKVSVHYVFPKSHPPFVKTSNELGNTCDPTQSSLRVTYRTTRRLSYPVNVCRNVARQAALTEFVLVSDVELIPSYKLASEFTLMLNKLATSKSNSHPSRVYVVPVFEIEKYEKIPRRKKELAKLIKEERALYFHRHICSHCQKFPGLENWIQRDNSDDVKPLTSVKREYPFHRWEPIFIGTKREPFYSEALCWEGKQDKMTQMLEMCLKGYKFIILDNAFLVHWPGVKRKSIDMKIRNKWRYPYLLKNTRQYNTIVNNLAAKYKKNPKCKLQ